MTLLTVKNLTKIYNKKAAIEDINFQFENEKCIALIGPNGAGKTTIIRILAGLLKQTSGTVQFAGMQPNDDIRSLIGYLPQYPVFYSWMTGMEFLVYSGELTFLTKAEAIKRANILLEKVGIADARNKRIGKYSGGMKQRLGIAQAIIHQPKLLLLDEPVSSLDPIGRREILTLMSALKKDMAILFSTHILTDADEISDELLVLNQGTILESGSIDSLRQKYQTATIEMCFEDNIELYQEKIKHLSSVGATSIKQNALHITFTEIHSAREEILALAAKENWPVTSFIINPNSLEDMFMKVVDK